MRKSLICLAALMIGAASLSAQNQKQEQKNQANESNPQATKMYLSVQGGGLVSLNENYASYGDNGKNANLLTGQGSVAIGFKFSPVHGARLWAGYANNRGACNTQETSAHGFYPYQFNSINAFVDYIMDFSGFSDTPKVFSPKAYLGVGIGNSSKFERGAGNQAPGNALHPWQTVTEKNTAFGFRAGIIFEFMVNNSFGVFTDFCGEFYSDEYNGLKPTKTDPGIEYNFPFDVRGLASLGVALHF